MVPPPAVRVTGAYGACAGMTEDNMGSGQPARSGNPKADAKAAKAYAKASRPWHKKKRYWLLALIAVVVIASSAGATGGDESGSSDSGDEAANGGSSSKPIKVTAKKILKEFEENEAAADSKYKGERVRVSGVVDKVDTEFIDEDEYVVRVGAGTDFDLTTVNCDDQSSEAVSSLKKGQDITVVGEFEDGGDLGVELKNCSIQ